MIFIRTHWFYAVWWEHWDGSSWVFHSTPLDSFDKALEHYDYLRSEGPDAHFRNIRVVKRPVGIPRETRFQS